VSLSLTPPVFLRDPASGELLAFASGDAAARHLAAWQEVGAVAAYDASGARVTFAVGQRGGALLSLLRIRREVVTVAGVERDAAGPEELRRALVVALAPSGERASLEELSLGELVSRGAERLRR
jgi:hypothetical protein